MNNPKKNPIDCKNNEDICTSKKNPSKLAKESITSLFSIKEKENSELSSLIIEEKSKISSSKYKTPCIFKQEETSYSKLEMPVSYQLTNGKCIRLQKSQISNSLIESEFNEINEEIAENSLKKLCEESSSEKIENKHKINFLDNKSFINYGKNDVLYPMKFIKRHYNKLIDNSSREQSDKIRKNIENLLKSYKKFNLMINPKYKYAHHFTSSPIHKFLPYCKKDDESYKQNLISYIRKGIPTISTGTRSTSGIYAKYAKSNTNEIPYNGDKNFFIFNKRKKIYSTKKIFAVEKNLYTYKLINGHIYVDFDHPKKFKFFFDNDIGFDKSWQSPLITANGDDDVETDDEVLGMAEEKCKEDLDEGITSWNKSNRMCRNFLLAKRLIGIPKSPVFNSHRVKNNISEKLKEENNFKFNKDDED